MAAPNAPTVNSPEDGTVLPLTSGVDFSWTHNDPESDAQAGWALKRRNWDAQADIGAEEWWNETTQMLPYSSPPTPVEIDTSTSATATQISNQRKVDRTSTGRLWAMVNSGLDVEFWYSDDGGDTWAQNTSATISSQVGGSFFIDSDDNAHVTYGPGPTSRPFRYRFMPAISSTSSWGSEVIPTGSGGTAVTDLIAHPEGTGWAVHIIEGYLSSPNLSIFHHRLTVSSSFVVTDEGQTTIGTYGSAAIEGYPSVDFNHTGDGKTVAGDTPHLYASWATSTSGSGQGIRFRKAVYSSGSWTWNAEREIDNTRYIGSVAEWLNCMFDGTRVVMVGEFRDGTNRDFVMYERNAADTTTETRVLLSDAGNTDRMVRGSATYDGDGNVFVFGQENSGANSPINYRKWTRSTTSLGTKVQVDATGGQGFLSCKRGYSDNRIEFIYTDGTASPYSVKYGVVAAEAAQGWYSDRGGEIVNAGAGTSKTISDWPADGDTYQYAIATSDDVLGAYTAWRSLNPFEWWDGSAWVPMSETFVTSAVENVTVDGGTFAEGANGDYLWTVATKDDAGLAGPYAAEDQLTIRGHRKWGVVHI